MALRRPSLSFFVSLCLTATAPFAAVEEPSLLTIYAGAIKGLHEYDGTGHYDQILLEMRDVSDVPFELVVQPISRAIRNFENCTDCCASPTTNDPEFFTYEDSVASAPMGVAKLYAFTRPGTDTVRSVEQLKDMKVGAKLGSHMGRTVSREVNLALRAPGLENGFQLLLQGRLDAFLAYTPDAYTVFEQLEMEPLPHNTNHPLAVHRDSVVCKGQQGVQFIQGLNGLLGLWQERKKLMGGP